MAHPEVHTEASVINETTLHIHAVSDGVPARQCTRPCTGRVYRPVHREAGVHREGYREAYSPGRREERSLRRGLTGVTVRRRERSLRRGLT